ncbi:MAG TPA: mercuric transporter MerT family protein [Thermoanaerobaculia bacterium]|nr:mercuric transporter MerT family protein [Thermoanaerobaculia bacterium]
MDERQERSLTQAGLTASVVTAIAASICCIGPIVAAFLGFTSLAALAKYEPLRPLFAGITVALLGGSFYFSYRKPPAETCEPGSVCAKHGATKVQKINRIVLWAITAIVIIVLTFPTWSNWVLG